MITVIISIISLIVYVFLFLYYLRMELVTLLLIFRRGIDNIFRRSDTKGKISKPSNADKLKTLFEQSLFFNHSMAILSMVVLISIVIYLPISEKLKLELLTIITSTVPYVWSYFRATNVGINGGIIGSLIGLSIFALKVGDFEWFLYHTPHFLLYSFLANVSGWLGGWVGSGQLREAVYAIVVKLKIGNTGSNIQGLTEIMKDTIQSHLESEYKNEIRYANKKPSLEVFDGEATCSVVSYRHEMEWQLVERPQKTAMGWLFKKEIPSTNIILDYMFNIFRSKVTKIIFLSEANPSSPLDEDNGGSIIHMVILNYKETPSIVWVDDEVKVLSDSIEKTIYSTFGGSTENRENQTTDFSLISTVQFAFRIWKERITLEQYSKETFGSKYPYEAIYESQLGNAQNIPVVIMNEIGENSTFFDQFRGSLLTFITFLFAQVIVAIIVNIASEGLASGIW